MSIKLMSYVWEHANAKGADLLLLLALADMANDDGDSWPSVATLAKRTRLDIRRVRRMLKQLEMDGIITRKHRFNGSGFTSTLYKISPSGIRASSGTGATTDTGTGASGGSGTGTTQNHKKNTSIEPSSPPVASGKPKAKAKSETKGQRVVRLATPYAGYIVGLVKLFRREIDVEFVGWERLNTAMLEEYTEHAESIQGAGLTADDLPGLHAYLQSKGWPSFGPRKMAEYALDYAAVKAKKIIPLDKPTDDTPSFYSAFMEENAS